MLVKDTCLTFKREFIPKFCDLTYSFFNQARAPLNFNLVFGTTKTSWLADQWGLERKINLEKIQKE